MLNGNGAFIMYTRFVPFDKSGALTPFGDFFNYEPPSAPISPFHGRLVPNADPTSASGSGVYDELLEEYQLKTMRDYQKGDQVRLKHSHVLSVESR